MDSKISLHHVDIILTYRCNSADREANLYAMLQHFDLIYTDYQIILVESDQTPKFDWLKCNNSKIKYYFIYGEGNFPKALLLNSGVKLSTSDVIVFNDIDCVLEPHTLAHSIHVLKTQNEFDIIYPYNEIIDVSGSSKANFLATPTYTHFVGKNGDNLNADMIRTCGTHAGGIKILRRSAYIKMGGVNTDMYGWGWEDTEFYIRSQRLGLNSTAAGAPLFHIQHDTIERDFNHPDALRNQNIKIATETMPIEELIALSNRLRTFFN